MATRKPVKKTKKAKKVDGNTVKRKAARNAAKRGRQVKAKQDEQELLDSISNPDHETQIDDAPVEEDFFADEDLLAEADELDEGEDSTPEVVDE